MSLDLDIEKLVPVDETVTMHHLVQGSDRRFAIPFNQRPWVWKSKNLEALWNDALRTVDKYFEPVGAKGGLKKRGQPTGNPHYFGAFLFFQRAPDVFEVVDGQQRLTSLCMLAAILREVAEGVSERNGDDIDLRHKAQGTATSLTTWLQADPGSQSPRLELDEQVDDLFRQYVVEPRNAEDRDKAYEQLPEAVTERRGSKSLKGGFDRLRELVVERLAPLSDDLKLEKVKALSAVIAEGFIATEIVVGDEPFALSVFGTLNSRGVSLNAADQIKNELFERADSSDFPQIKEDWDAIVDHVPEGNIELFLRQRHLAFESTNCPKSQLYAQIREKELEDAAVTSVTARWRRDAELLSFLTLERSHPKIKEDTERRLRTLHEQLKIRYSWPLLLSAGHRFFPNDLEDFEKLVRLTLSFCFRILTIGKRDIAELERPVAKAALALTEGAEPKAIAKQLREANSDEQFKEDFSRASLRRADTQFYALYELEIHRTSKAGLSIEPFPQSPHQNVEHILPRKPSMAESRLDEWIDWRDADDWPSEEHGQYVNRLGNLLILEGEINRHVSNYDFEAKRSGDYPDNATTVKGEPRKSYADSKLSLVKDVLDEYDYPEWTEQEIEQRQTAMADEAAKAWTLRYV